MDERVICNAGVTVLGHRAARLVTASGSTFTPSCARTAGPSVAIASSARTAYASSQRAATSSGLSHSMRAASSVASASEPPTMLARKTRATNGSSAP